MMTDSIADLLTRIRNASLKNHASCMAPFSKIKQSIAEVLKKAGMIQEVATVEEGKRTYLEIHLYHNRSFHIKRISSPGRRLYVASKDLPTVKSGLGVAILSTSKGIMSNKDAKKQHIGGELLCEVY